MVPIIRGIDQACFRERLPDLAEFCRLPAAGLDAGLFSLVDCGPQETKLALGLGVAEEEVLGVLPVASLLVTAREDHALIERVGVLPEHRRQGYAAGLLAAAVLEGRKVGLRVWGVELREEDLASQTFFRHLGFAALPASDSSRGYFGDQDAIVMTREV